MWKVVVPLVLAAVLAVGLGGLVGGFIDLPVDDSRASEALHFAVNSHNRASNDLFRHEVQEVVSVKSQVVAGMKYVIKVKMAKTDCRKGSVEESCPASKNLEAAKPYECTFTVWSRPWMNTLQLIDERCNESNI